MAVQIISTGVMAYGGAVFTSSAGTKLAVVITNSNVLQIYSDVDGTPSLEDQDTTTTIFGSSVSWSGMHAAIDSNDDIHIIAAHGSGTTTRDVAYCKATESAGAWTLGTWELISAYTDTGPSNSNSVHISIDSSDFPHVAYCDGITLKGSTQTQIFYSERTGGSWATPTQLSARSDKTDGYSYPVITLKGSDNIEVMYNQHTGSTNQGDILYQTYTASWSGESVYAEVSSKPVGLTVTSGGTVYRYHWKSSSDDIEENNSAVSVTSTVSPLDNRTWMWATLDGTDRYLIMYDVDDDIHLWYNTGSGWTDGGELFAGTVQGLAVEWSYNNLNRSGELSFIYQDFGNGIYYDSYTLTAAERRVFITHA